VREVVMTVAFDREMSRRAFLASHVAGALALGVVVSRSADVDAVEDAPYTHNMLVFGEQTVFLSHLPMFDAINKTKTDFRSPHRYQVILEAAFTKEGKGLRDIYVKDRQAHPATRIYTLNPDTFVLSLLFTPTKTPKLTSFTATVFRGHLEQGGKPVPGLEKILVEVGRVIYGRKFDPRVKNPGTLEYLLVGKGPERFLVHAIFAAPNFDQVVSVKSTGHELTDADLSEDVRVAVPNRRNIAAERLREGEKVQAFLLRLGPAQGKTPLTIRIEVGPQVYFEEGELRVPPTFEATPEEKKG
jgi:hypothetical protein